jgi:hypothetical protein
MVYTSHVIVNKIREANSTQDVRIVIENWRQSLRTSMEDNRIDRKYTMDILMALRYNKLKESNMKSIDNFKLAIDILKKLHSEGRENLW